MQFKAPSFIDHTGNFVASAAYVRAENTLVSPSLPALLLALLFPLPIGCLALR